MDCSPETRIPGGWWCSPINLTRARRRIIPPCQTQSAIRPSSDAAVQRCSTVLILQSNKKSCQILPEFGGV